MGHLSSLLKFGVCVKHGACSGEEVGYPVPTSPLHRLEGRRREEEGGEGRRREEEGGEGRRREEEGGEGRRREEEG